MVRRELSTLKRCECDGGNSNGGSSNGGNSRRTYNLKLIGISKGEGGTRNYIDKSPDLVYADFNELVKQKYYIKYAEGTTSIHSDVGDVGDGQSIAVDVPSIYIGTCNISTRTTTDPKMSSINGSYYIAFDAGIFTLSVGITGKSDNNTVVTHGEITPGGDYFENSPATQYNNEDLGNEYIILDLTFVWESLE